MCVAASAPLQEMEPQDEGEGQLEDLEPSGASVSSVTASMTASLQPSTVPPAGMAMVGVTRKMTRNAAVYTVHIGPEHSNVSGVSGVERKGGRVLLVRGFAHHGRAVCTGTEARPAGLSSRGPRLVLAWAVVVSSIAPR